MTYRVVLSPMAVRQLRTLDAQLPRRIPAALELLAGQPRPPSAIRLVGGSGEWRVRTGDYRIVDEIEDDRLLVLVLRVGHRREVYACRRQPTAAGLRAAPSSPVLVSAAGRGQSERMAASHSAASAKAGSAAVGDTGRLFLPSARA